MPIQIGEKPSPGFDDPLGLLSDCHRRVERFLRALILVAEQAQGAALNARQREALETALRYFREAAPKHTADEEQSLFPRMRASQHPAVNSALAKIQALEADHQVAGDAHAVVERLGQQWLQRNALALADLAGLRHSLEELHRIYQRHIAVEDNEVFPLARNILAADALQEVGREMAQRRGQSMK